MSKSLFFLSLGMSRKSRKLTLFSKTSENIFVSSFSSDKKITFFYGSSPIKIPN
jgi:hypothetical protein